MLTIMIITGFLAVVGIWMVITPLMYISSVLTTAVVFAVVLRMFVFDED